MRADRVPARLLHVLDRGDEAREELVLLRPGLEAGGERIVGRRAHLVRAQLREQLGAGEEEAQVRPEELVRRAEQDVRARGRDVDRPVRRVVDGVDPGERARLVREGGDPRPRRSRCRRRSPPSGNATTRVLSESCRSRSSRSSVQSSWMSTKRTVEAAVVRHGEPGRDVRVVVEPRHEDLVAGAQALARERAREAEVERRHVRPEADLLRGRAEEPRRGRARVVDERVGGHARRERAAGVRVRLLVVGRDAPG